MQAVDCFAPRNLAEPQRYHDKFGSSPRDHDAMAIRDGAFEDFVLSVSQRRHGWIGGWRPVGVRVGGGSEGGWGVGVAEGGALRRKRANDELETARMAGGGARLSLHVAWRSGDKSTSPEAGSAGVLRRSADNG